MAGSRKGEKRGAAGRARRKTSHESGADIIRDALRPGAKSKRVILERRFEVARIINGETRLAIDMSMKEMMAFGATWHMEAAQDWKNFWQKQMAVQPPTEESSRAVLFAEQQIAAHLAQCTDHAFKAAPYLESRRAPVPSRSDTGDSAHSIMDDLLEDIDQRERENSSLLIEHEAIKKIG